MGDVVGWRAVLPQPPGHLRACGPHGDRWGGVSVAPTTPPAWAASANRLNAPGLPVVPLSCSDDLSMEPTDCLQEVIMCSDSLSIA